MANEFIARKGLISSGSVQVTGSLITTAGITGSILANNGVISSSTQIASSLPTGVVSSSTQIATLLPSNIVSSSTQVKALLPDGSVSSSAQYPGWVTSSSQIDYNSIQNKLSGVISSSTQFNALSNTSASFATTASAATSITFIPTSASYAVTASYVSGAASDWNSLSNKPSDLVSSSTQVKAFLPNGTVSSSAQYPGWVTASSQIDYNSIQNKLSGVVSSSTQVQPLLPGGTVSSSVQYPGWVTASSQVLLNAVTGTTFSNQSFYFPNDLKVEGNLTAQQIYTEYVSSSVIYESGSSKFGDSADDVMSVTGSILVLGGRISGSMVGMFSASSQIDYNSIQNKLSGVVSSSIQIQPLLPDGIVSSSAQYSGWVTASSQIDYNSIQNKLSGVISSSTQIQPLLPNGTVSSSTQIVWSSVNYNSGIVSSSTQVQLLLPTGTVSSSLQINTGSFSGSITSASYALTASYAANAGGLAGVISSSTQFKTLTDPFTGSFTGSLTGALVGTASWATSASWAPMIAVAPLSSSVNIDTYTFIGNGVVSNYILSQSYDVASLFVSVDGLVQTNITDYTLSSNTISFIEPPPSQSNVLVKALVNVTQNVTGSFSGSFFGVVATASFATTASYALNAGAGAGFPYSGSAVITGSLLVIPTGSVGGITGSVSGALTGTFPYNSLTSIPSDIVSSSTQVKTFLPNGTVSASAQYPGWVTASSQIDYNSIQNKLSGVVSSSTQIQPLLPNGTVSSSAQYPGWVTASSQIVWSSVNYNTGIVSSSAQIKILLPDGTISSSGQYPGWVTASSQVDITATTNYTTFSSSLATVDANQTTRIDNLASLTSSYAINSTIQSQLAGVVSSSSQVKPLLPGGTVSSSAQYPGWVTASSQIQLDAITGTTFSNQSFYFPNDLKVEGNLTAQQIYTEYVSSSVIYESGSSKFGDSADDVMSVTGSIRVLGGNISGSFVGLISSSAQVDYNNIQNKLSGVVSSSTQFNALTNTSASFATTASAATSITFTPATASFATTASYASSGSWLRTKSGVTGSGAFAGVPRIATITFTTPFPNTNYAVVVTGEDSRGWSIQNKLSGSFVINSNSNTALAGNTYWIATAYGET